MALPEGIFFKKIPSGKAMKMKKMATKSGGTTHKYVQNYKGRAQALIFLLLAC